MGGKLPLASYGAPVAAQGNANPPIWKLVAAFLIAPLIPAALFATYTLFDRLPNGSYFQTLILVAVLGAYLPTLLIGIPAYLVMRREYPPRLAIMMATGAFVAAFPWLALALLGSPDQAIDGSHVTVRDSYITLWGWVELLKLLTVCGCLGALGGSVFWLITMGSSHRG